MLESSLVYNWLKSRTPFLLLLSLFFFPILPFGLMSILIIATSVVSILSSYSLVKCNLKRIGLRPLLINSLFFLLFFLTLIYTDNLKEGWRKIEVGLSFFIIPLIIFYFQPKINNRQINLMCYGFVISNLLFIFYLYFYLVNNASDFNVIAKPGLTLFVGLKDKSILDQLLALWDGTFYEVFYYASKAKESILFIHKAYASLGMVFSILITTFFLFQFSKWYLKIGCVILIIVFSIVVVYLFSLISLFILFFIVPIFIFFLFKTKKNKILYVLGLLVVFSVTLNLFLLKTNHSGGEYEKYLSYESPAHVFLNINDMFKNDLRNALNQCNYELFKNQPLLGYGIGDVQDNLQLCYSKYSDTSEMFNNAEEQVLNSHNYYAFLVLSGGVILILAFVLMVGNNLFVSIQKKDLIYFFFLLIISISLLTENMFVRINGVLFFSLFNSIFYYKNIILNDSNE